jgi:hypothetical protein
LSTRGIYVQTSKFHRPALRQTQCGHGPRRPKSKTRMSKGFAASSNPQRSYSSVYRAPTTAQNTLGANGLFSKSLSGPSSSIGSAIWQAPAHWNVGSSTAPQQPTVSYKKPPKVKKRTPEELEITKQKAARLLHFVFICQLSSSHHVELRRVLPLTKQPS